MLKEAQKKKKKIFVRSECLPKGHSGVSYKIVYKDFYLYFTLYHQKY